MTALYFLCFSLLFPVSFLAAGAQQPGTLQGDSPPQQDVTVSLRPSIAIVIGIFSIMFSLTFLLLVYAKFCHTASDAELFSHDRAEDGGRHRRPNGLLAPNSRFSGIDKAIIESLPFFRFSSLRGAREGLECAVCLSKFEGAEVLRLLPKCKHAFHVDCVDRWLESHSSCPLCRCKVELEDLTLFKYSTSSRSLFRDPSAGREEADLELYVEREPAAAAADRPPSSRFAWAGSFRKAAERGGKENKKDEVNLLDGGDGGGSASQFLHKHKHKIVFSDVVFKNRWSDVNSADLISLKTEMLNLLSSKRFAAADSSGELRAGAAAERRCPGQDRRAPPTTGETVIRIKEEMERKRALESKAGQHMTCGRGRPTAPPPTSPPSSDRADADPSDSPRSILSNSAIPSGNNRCMSEIVNVSRFADASGRDRGPPDNPAAGKGTPEDEKVRRLWLPIARRTVQWFAGRDQTKRSESDQQTGTAGTPAV